MISDDHNNNHLIYLHVIRPGHNPVLPRHEDGGPHRQLAHLEALDELLGLVVPDVNIAIVEGDQHPLLGGVEVAGLHPIRPRCQPPVDIKPQWHLCSAMRRS